MVHIAYDFFVCVRLIIDPDKISVVSLLLCKALSCDPTTSVRPSVCLSATLVDCNHIGWKYWKLILHGQLAQHLYALRSQRQSTYTPRGTWGNFAETGGKTGVLEHKSGNVTETRRPYNYRGKVRATMEGTNQRSFRRYHSRPGREVDCLTFRSQTRGVQ